MSGVATDWRRLGPGRRASDRRWWLRRGGGRLGGRRGGVGCGCLLGETAWFSHSGCRLGTAAGVCQREWANGQLVRGHVPASNQK